MKLRLGSIQQKGRLFYLVTRRNGKQCWLALKTGDAKIAAERAKAMLPGTEDETAWLRHLIGMGRAAETALARLKAAEMLTWDNIADAYDSACGRRLTGTQRTAYDRWLDILGEKASALGIASPPDLSSDIADKIAKSFSDSYISGRRMVAFFRHCWNTLGLDSSIWSLSAGTRLALFSAGKPREHYRRLSLKEIRLVYARLAETERDLSDIFAIGYLTGLRLSDITELEQAEIAPTLDRLTITPNKTREKKPNPLTIPLIREAKDIVTRRMAVLAPAVQDNPTGRRLFPDLAQTHVSQRIASAFRNCGLVKSRGARASFHSLRATFISMMDEAGIPPHLTDAITGHGGGGMHARYTQPSFTALRDAMLKSIPPLCSCESCETVPPPESPPAAREPQPDAFI